VVLLGCSVVIGGREKERERQKLERGERWERIEMVLGLFYCVVILF